MELKFRLINDVLSAAVFKSHLYGIEIRNLLPQINLSCCLNRTFMELKSFVLFRALLEVFV